MAADFLHAAATLPSPFEALHLESKTVLLLPV
jgi:hypothetical protein